MTAHERITAEGWPDLAAFLAWVEDQPERPLAESLVCWRAESEARDRELRYRAFGAEMAEGRGY